MDLSLIFTIGMFLFSALILVGFMGTERVKGIVKGMVTDKKIYAMSLMVIHVCLVGYFFAIILRRDWKFVIVFIGFLIVISQIINGNKIRWPE